MFVVWQGIDVETKFYNSTVRRSMPELDIITYQIRKMEGLLYVAFTISVKESENNKTNCKGLSQYSCKNKCYNNVEYRNFDLNIKI